MENQAVRVTAPAPRRRGPASTEGGQRSRDRILKAALELIIEAGIDQVRVAEIARRAGMSSGQVMYYFTSKEHILLETLAWSEHEDIMGTRAALAKASGVWHQLERFIGRYLPVGQADPSWILWMEAWARVPHNRQVGKFLEELHNPWRDALAAIVARGVQEGAFAPAADIDDFTLLHRPARRARDHSPPAHAPPLPQAPHRACHDHRPRRADPGRCRRARGPISSLPGVSQHDGESWDVVETQAFHPRRGSAHRREREMFV